MLCTQIAKWKCRKMKKTRAHIDAFLGKVQVQLGANLRVWIQTSLSLSVGDTVIVARNDQDALRLIVQYSQRSLPAQGTLQLI